MIFDNFVKSFVVNYRGGKDLKNVIATLRRVMQFHDAPSLSMMQSGEVDCFGAAVITRDVLHMIWPEEEFLLVTVPKLPWLDEQFNFSKHSCIIRKNRQGITFIDSTPINGYGYGLISKEIPISEWNCDDTGRNWELKKTNDISDINFWEDHLYSNFVVLDKTDINPIIKLTEAHHILRNNQKPRIDFEPPQFNVGWQKDYWRTLAKIADSQDNPNLAFNNYNKALAISPNDIHLLDEYIRFARQRHLSSNLINKSTKLLNELQAYLISAHSKAIKAWNKASDYYYHEAIWEKYLYYLGAVFWRRQSVSIIKGTKAIAVPSVNIAGTYVPLYRITPAWFMRKNLGVALLDNVNSNYLHQEIAGKWSAMSLEKRDFNRYFLKLNLKKDFRISIVESNVKYNNVSPIKTTNDHFIAHLWFVGITNPELLII